MSKEETKICECNSPSIRTLYKVEGGYKCPRCGKMVAQKRRVKMDKVVQKEWGFELPKEYDKHELIKYMLDLDKAGVEFWETITGEAVSDILEYISEAVDLDLIPKIEGYKVIGYREPRLGELLLDEAGQVTKAKFDYDRVDLFILQEHQEHQENQENQENKDIFQDLKYFLDNELDLVQDEKYDELYKIVDKIKEEFNEKDEIIEGNNKLIGMLQGDAIPRLQAQLKSAWNQVEEKDREIKEFNAHIDELKTLE